MLLDNSEILSDYFQYFLTSFIFTFFATPVFIRILEKYQILESPGKRKIHKTHTASLGGIPVFLAVLATIIIWWPAHMIDEFKMLLAATILMFLIGLGFFASSTVLKLRFQQKNMGMKKKRPN